MSKYGVDDKLGRLTKDDDTRGVFTNFAFGTGAAGMQIETQRLVLRRLDRSLPLEFRPVLTSLALLVQKSKYRRRRSSCAASTEHSPSNSGR